VTLGPVPLDSYLEVGKAVRRLRLQHALTQEQLADEAKISAKTVSRVETGHKTHGSTYRKLARALGVPVKELLAPLLEEEQNA